MNQPSLFGGQRLQMNESIDLTIASLNAYGPTHKHWAIAWSGGKDSTTLVTLVAYLVGAGKVQRPETLTVLYADTRMELLPLYQASIAIREELAELGFETRTALAPMDKRFFVYVLGRGVPPPNNNTLRWCTRQIKIDPMAEELERLFGDRGEKVLLLTGVRQGESAIRDGRIAMSCGRNGAECGQGWYQETMPEQLCDTLAPLLHWRVCHVWEWLKHWAPTAEFGDWSTRQIADAYGGDEAEEINARTGCIGCPLANQDTALDSVVQQSQWAYLAPLKGLRPIYRSLRSPLVRLKKRGIERRKDGSAAHNPQRMGPIVFEARLEALDKILLIQKSVNDAAAKAGRPPIDLINASEEARIRELIANKTWPQKWSSDDALATEMMDSIYPDGSVQKLLAGFGGMES